jgi:hypothetical protein
MFWLQRTKEGNGSNVVAFFLFFAHGAPKKAMVVTLPSFFFSWLQQTKEGDDNNIAVTFLFYFFGWNEPKKATTTTLSSPFFFFGFNEPKKAMAALLPSPSSFIFLLQRTKEGDGSCRHLLFCFFGCSDLPKKAMATFVAFFFCFLVIVHLGRRRQQHYCCLLVFLLL